MNSNGGHEDVETRVGALSVRYCAIPEVSQDDGVDDGGRDENWSAEADTLRGGGNDVVFASQKPQQRRSNEQRSSADGNIEIVCAGERDVFEAG